MRTIAFLLMPAALLVLAPWCGTAQVGPQDVEFRVRLLSPLNSDTNRKGDKVTASVTEPPQFAGSILEGRVTQAKSSGKIKGTSVLSFTFETLYYRNQPSAVSTQIKAASNSKGQLGVDEEGRVLRHKNQLGKVALVGGIGAIIGAVAGGAKGAAIGAGAGAAAALLLIEVGTQGANVEFAAGAELVLAVRDRQ